MAVKTFKTKKFSQWFTEPIFLIFGVIIFSLVSYQILPSFVIRGALSISLSLKSFLLFFIPFLIFSGTALAFSSLQKNGMFFILCVMGLVVASNFINLMLSGFVGFYLIPLTSNTSYIPVTDATKIILPYFSLQLHPILSNTSALLGGITIGIACAFYRIPKVIKAIQLLHRYTMYFMMHCFIPLLPFFLLGFLLKLLAEGQLANFVQGNLPSCLLMIGFLCFYLWLWLVAAKNVSGKPSSTIIRNIFPAMVTAASTMSSAAALPFSIKAATENTKDPVLANAVMPVTLNFHMVGDTICIPIMAIIILNTFNCALPTWQSFMLFGAFFVLNKFAGAGIPGGTIMVSLPVLQQYLGFNEEMLALIAAFYMLIDPITTTGNVTANNLLIIFVKKMLHSKTASQHKEAEVCGNT